MILFLRVTVTEYTAKNNCYSMMRIVSFHVYCQKGVSPHAPTPYCPPLPSLLPPFHPSKKKRAADIFKCILVIVFFAFNCYSEAVFLKSRCVVIAFHVHCIAPVGSLSFAFLGLMLYYFQHT